MVELEFTEDYSTRKKGDKVPYKQRYADYLIGIGVAKKAAKKVEKKVVETKDEKATKKTK